MATRTRTRYIACHCGQGEQRRGSWAGHSWLLASNPRHGACPDCGDTGVVAQQYEVRDLWGPTPLDQVAPLRDLHDITKPPPGCQPVRCTGGCDDGQVDIPRAVVGPVEGTPLRPGELTTLLRPAKCRACRGRGWVWGYDGPPGTNS